MTDVVVSGGIIEEVFAVRKKKRPAMRIVLGGIESGNGNWLASGSRNAKHARRRIGSKHDNSPGAPACAARDFRLAQINRGCALTIKTFELSVGEKTERAAVRRPEWPGCAVSAGHRVRRQGVERLYVELNLAGVAGNECNPPAVRRNGNRGRRIARGQELRSFWGRDNPASTCLGWACGVRKKVK